MQKCLDIMVRGDFRCSFLSPEEKLTTSGKSTNYSTVNSEKSIVVSVCFFFDLLLGNREKGERITHIRSNNLSRTHNHTVMASRDLKGILNRYTDNNVGIKRGSKADALRVWEEPVREILANVARRDSRFEIRNVLYGGSYYERLKVKEPDEFDIMLEMKKLELDDQPYEEDDHLGVEPPVGQCLVIPVSHPWMYVLLKPSKMPILFVYQKN